MHAIFSLVHSTVQYSNMLIACEPPYKKIHITSTADDGYDWQLQYGGSTTTVRRRRRVAACPSRVPPARILTVLFCTAGTQVAYSAAARTGTPQYTAVYYSTLLPAQRNTTVQLGTYGYNTVHGKAALLSSTVHQVSVHRCGVP